jgi:hypothetical protein
LDFWFENKPSGNPVCDWTKGFETIWISACILNFSCNLYSNEIIVIYPYLMYCCFCLHTISVKFDVACAARTV